MMTPSGSGPIQEFGMEIGHYQSIRPNGTSPPKKGERNRSTATEKASENNGLKATENAARAKSLQMFKINGEKLFNKACEIEKISYDVPPNEYFVCLDMPWKIPGPSGFIESGDQALTYVRV